jgi:hypothetical protein
MTQRTVLPELPSVLVAKPAPDFSQFSFSEIGKEKYGKPNILKARLGIGVPPPNFRTHSAPLEPKIEVQGATSDEDMEVTRSDDPDAQLDKNATFGSNSSTSPAQKSSELRSQEAEVGGGVSFSLPLSGWRLPGSSPEKIKYFHFQPLWDDAESVRREWASVERPEITTAPSMSPCQDQEVSSQPLVSLGSINQSFDNATTATAGASTTPKDLSAPKPPTPDIKKGNNPEKQEEVVLTGTTDILKLSNTLGNVKSAGKVQSAVIFTPSEMQQLSHQNATISSQQSGLQAMQVVPNPHQHTSSTPNYKDVHSKNGLLGPRVNNEKPDTTESETIVKSLNQSDNPVTLGLFERNITQSLAPKPASSTERPALNETRTTQGGISSNAHRSKQQIETRRFQGPTHRESSNIPVTSSLFHDHPSSRYGIDREGRGISSKAYYNDYGRPLHRSRPSSPGRRIQRNDRSPPRRGAVLRRRRSRTPPTRGPWTQRGRSRSRSFSRSRSRSYSRSYSPPPRNQGLYGPLTRGPPYGRGFGQRERSRSRSPRRGTSSIRSRISSPRSRPLSIGRRSVSPSPRTLVDRVYPATRPLHDAQSKEWIPSGPTLNPVYGDRRIASQPSIPSSNASKGVAAPDVELDHKTLAERLVTPSQHKGSASDATAGQVEEVAAKEQLNAVLPRVKSQQANAILMEDKANKVEAILSPNLGLKRARENDAPQTVSDDPLLDEPSAKRKHLPSFTRAGDERPYSTNSSKQELQIEASRTMLVSAKT